MIALAIANNLELFGGSLRETRTLSDNNKKRFVEMTMQLLTWNTYKHIQSEL